MTDGTQAPPTFQRPCPAFPDAFLKGVGMSVWQNSADGPQPAPSNWQHFTEAKKDYFGQREYANSAWKTSNDFWNKCVRGSRHSLGAMPGA